MTAARACPRCQPHSVHTSWLLLSMPCIAQPKAMPRYSPMSSLTNGGRSYGTWHLKDVPMPSLGVVTKVFWRRPSPATPLERLLLRDRDRQCVEVLVERLFICTSHRAGTGSWTSYKIHHHTQTRSYGTKSREAIPVVLMPITSTT